LLHSLIALPIFFIPGVYSYLLVNTTPITDPYTIVFILAAVGITIGHYALILVSQAEDTPADRKMELYTPAVKWGVQKTLHISYISNIIGSFISVLSIIFLFLFVNYWFLIIIPLIIIGRYFSMKEVYLLYKESSSLQSEIELLHELRKKMNYYPLWHAYGLSGITFSSLCILIVKTMGWSVNFFSNNYLFNFIFRFFPHFFNI
jgi:hypothetical protein